MGALAVAAVAQHPAVALGDPLTRSSFAPYLHSTFHVVDGAQRVPVVLSRIDDLAATTPSTSELRFSLVFEGHGHRPLPQHTRRLVHPRRRPVDLFIVPVGQPSDRQTYQAIIYRSA